MQIEGHEKHRESLGDANRQESDRAVSKKPYLKKIWIQHRAVRFHLMRPKGPGETDRCQRQDGFLARPRERSRFLVQEESHSER